MPQSRPDPGGVPERVHDVAVVRSTVFVGLLAGLLFDSLLVSAILVVLYF